MLEYPQLEMNERPFCPEAPEGLLNPLEAIVLKIADGLGVDPASLYEPWPPPPIPNPAVRHGAKMPDGRMA